MSVVAPADSFEIKTEVFEGPLELLLELVEKRKLLINDISLAEVTDEYMATVADMQERSLPNTAQFVQLAATLLLIKSKSLLPVLELTREEEESVDDLEQRLKRYALYRDLGEQIGKQFGATVLHERQFVRDKKPLFVTDNFTTLEGLHNAIGDVLVNLPRKQEKPKVRVKQVISLEQMIDRLHNRIQREFKVRFSDLLENEQEKGVVIVGFLAILESVKQGSVLVAQATRFDDIEIEREGSSDSSVPRYM